jgi:hypothetical protein
MKRTPVRCFAAAWLSVLAWTMPGRAAQIEARAGYFIPSSRDVRDVYPNGLAFGADVTVPVAKALCAWGGLDYFRRTGKLTLTAEPTTLRVMPFFAGLKLQSAGRSVRPYASAAAGYFFYREASVIGTVTGGRIGLVAQAGLLLKIKGKVSLDLHVRYTACRAKSGGTDPVTTELGGFQGGLGISVGI